MDLNASTDPLCIQPAVCLLDAETDAPCTPFKCVPASISISNLKDNCLIKNSILHNLYIWTHTLA